MPSSRLTAYERFILSRVLFTDVFAEFVLAVERFVTELTLVVGCGWIVWHGVMGCGRFHSVVVIRSDFSFLRSFVASRRKDPNVGDFVLRNVRLWVEVFLVGEFVGDVSFRSSASERRRRLRPVAR